TVPCLSCPVYRKPESEFHHQHPVHIRSRPLQAPPGTTTSLATPRISPYASRVPDPEYQTRPCHWKWPCPLGLRLQSPQKSPSCPVDRSWERRVVHQSPRIA